MQYSRHCISASHSVYIYLASRSARAAHCRSAAQERMIHLCCGRAARWCSAKMTARKRRRMLRCACGMARCCPTATSRTSSMCARVQHELVTIGASLPRPRSAKLLQRRASEGIGTPTALRRMQALPQRLTNVAIVCLSSPVRCLQLAQWPVVGATRNRNRSVGIILRWRYSPRPVATAIGTQACEAVWRQDQSRRRRRRRLRTLRRLYRRHRCLGSRW